MARVVSLAGAMLDIGSITTPMRIVLISSSPSAGPVRSHLRAANSVAELLKYHLWPSIIRKVRKRVFRAFGQLWGDGPAAVPSAEQSWMYP